MADLINFSDLVESNGNTVRQNNLMLDHNIPIGTMVEIIFEEDQQHGMRVFIAEHSRDCDGTPTYGLTMDPSVSDKISELTTHMNNHPHGSSDHQAYDQLIKIYQMKIDGCWGEDSLKVISNPKEGNVT